jgi:dihydroflavonol-4-reductase
MKVAVTGASGHVGANLVRALLSRGDFVRALVHREAAALEGLDVDRFRGDLTDATALERCFDGMDVVFHLAAHIAISGRDSSAAEKVNITGVRNVVDACLGQGVRRLVHFSSIHAMADPPGGGWVDESTPLVLDQQLPSYDRSKAVGEWLALEAADAGLEVVVLAPTAVVGPYDFRPSFFGRVLLLMARGRLPLTVDGGFDWVDARDIAAAAVAAAAHPSPSRKYVLSGHWRSLREVSHLLAASTGCDSRLSVPLSLARICAPAGDLLCRIAGWTPLFTPYAIEALRHHRFVSHERATRELGYAPRAIEETLADTHRWFVERGWLPACGALEGGGH